MKSFIFSMLAAILLAVVIGVGAYNNGPGYVVFSFADYTIETSFVFVLGALIVGYFVFYYSMRVVSNVLNLPNYISRRHDNRKNERSKNALIKGLIDMSEGRFEQAEKILIKQVDLGSTLLLNYLMAARSAQQLGAYDRRDEYLRLAHESTPSADIAIGLTQAELQLSHKQLEQALATLNHLSSVSPKHGYVKKLLANVYKQLGDWDSLGPLLEDIRKLKIMDEVELDKDEIKAFYGMLKNSIKQGDSDKTDAIWEKVPKRINSNYKLIRIYVKHLSRENRDEQAEALVRNYLSANWQDELALLYSNLLVGKGEKQLETAETWLHGQSRSAVLLLVLGKLSINCQLWGKARGYLESSIGIKPMAEAYLTLANLLEEKMDEPKEAQKMYQEGLKTAVTNDFIGKYSALSNDRIGTPVLKIIKPNVNNNIAT